MSAPRITRVCDPKATREAILEAACTLLAKDGPEGISLSEVAKLAGINRGTAYQHFETREKLIDAATADVSDTMFRAVFGEPDTVGERNVGQVDIADMTDRLVNFAMENPELCRVWLLQLLSSPDPTTDPFWREYAGSLERFAATGLAQDGVDAEALSVITLAGSFLWPVWARSHAQSDDERGVLTRRFAQEMLRLSMFGSVRPEHYPEIAERLGKVRNKPVKLRAVGA
jgi:AcrR family transcriptional regulator